MRFITLAPCVLSPYFIMTIEVVYVGAVHKAAVIIPPPTHARIRRGSVAQAVSVSRDGEAAWHQTMKQL